MENALMKKEHNISDHHMETFSSLQKSMLMQQPSEMSVGGLLKNSEMEGNKFGTVDNDSILRTKKVPRESEIKANKKDGFQRKETNKEVSREDEIIYKAKNRFKGPRENIRYAEVMTELIKKKGTARVHEKSTKQRSTQNLKCMKENISWFSNRYKR
mmetsp:Transcript_32722/g.75301  ORF Transcript_32722/g.75301 Transcript_32722/m.75301 type:complete len:157 (+) Transcript_32722:1651-2121(+)